MARLSSVLQPESWLIKVDDSIKYTNIMLYYNLYLNLAKRFICSSMSLRCIFFLKLTKSIRNVHIIFYTLSIFEIGSGKTVHYLKTYIL